VKLHRWIRPGSATGALGSSTAQATRPHRYRNHRKSRSSSSVCICATRPAPPCARKAAAGFGRTRGLRCDGGKGQQRTAQENTRRSSAWPCAASSAGVIFGEPRARDPAPKRVRASTSTQKADAVFRGSSQRTRHAPRRRDLTMAVAQDVNIRRPAPEAHRLAVSHFRSSSWWLGPRMGGLASLQVSTLPLTTVRRLSNSAQLLLYRRHRAVLAEGCRAAASRSSCENEWLVRHLHSNARQHGPCTWHRCSQPCTLLYAVWAIAAVAESPLTTSILRWLTGSSDREWERRVNGCSLCFAARRSAHNGAGGRSPRIWLRSIFTAPVCVSLREWCALRRVEVPSEDRAPLTARRPNRHPPPRPCATRHRTRVRCLCPSPRKP
jgi:hypothetical protein